MSSIRIKHWTSRSEPLSHGLCSYPGCTRPGDEVIQGGKLRCSWHIPSGHVTVQHLRPGQRIGR